jgi:hypothetical protein
VLCDFGELNLKSLDGAGLFLLAFRDDVFAMRCEDTVQTANQQLRGRIGGGLRRIRSVL